MPISGRIIVCSALATILIYSLYRKRRKQKYLLDLTEEVVLFQSRNHSTESITEETTISVGKVCSDLPAAVSEDMMDYVTEYPLIEAVNMTTNMDIGRSPNSSDSGSVQARTPESTFSPDFPNRSNLPPGCFDDPTNDVYEDNPEEMNGTFIPKVLIPSDLWAEGVDQDIWHETFCVPAHMGGVLIGRLGKAKYMRTPFQAIHVNWAHAFPVFSDVPDIHILRTFFTSGRLQAFAVRMETCCRASVAFSEPYPPPYSSHGLMDVLVNACNSGLYMAVPLVVYPNRQSWLNQTDIPYYPCSYSAIDYPALVNFAPDEETTFPVTDCGPTAAQTSETANQLTENRNGAPHPSQRHRTTRGGFVQRRPHTWHPRFNGRGGGSNVYPKSSTFSQKENENQSQPGDVKTSIELGTSAEQTTNDNTEPKRRPLRVRNARGSSSVFRGPSIRGRGYTSRFRDY